MNLVPSKQLTICKNFQAANIMHLIPSKQLIYAKYFKQLLSSSRYLQEPYFKQLAAISHTNPYVLRQPKRGVHRSNDARDATLLNHSVCLAYTPLRLWPIFNTARRNVAVKAVRGQVEILGVALRSLAEAVWQKQFGHASCKLGWVVCLPGIPSKRFVSSIQRQTDRPTDRPTFQPTDLPNEIRAPEFHSD